MAAKLGSWMSQAKVKCNEHLENPDSKVNFVRRSVKGRLIKVMLGEEENKTNDEKFLVHKSIMEEELK